MLGLAKLGQAAIGLGALLGAGALALLAPHQTPDMRSHGVLPKYYGVNLPTAGFGHLPGVYGKDYVFDSRRTAAPFLAMGMTAVRVAVRWERLQPVADAPLDPVELARLDHAIEGFNGFQLIIIDVHNYARYRHHKLDEASGSQLADLWSKLAVHYRSDPRIAFAIMNEPHDIGAHVWRNIAEQVVAAIRQTGAKNLVLVPGTNWSGGHSWNKGGDDSNAVAMKGFSDPGRNFVFEIHQYLDIDSSGTHDDCLDEDVGPRRLAGVTNWLRAQHAKAFLGEFGVPPTPVCLRALDHLLEFLNANGDVWLGWTYWAGGARWHNYPYSIQPEGGQEKPQAAVLRKYIRGSR